MLVAYLLILGYDATVLSNSNNNNNNKQICIAP